MLKIIKVIVSLLFLFILTCPANLFADENSIIPIEKITNFHSDIIVSSDSSMTVTETITVNCLGDQIRHGIYRDFPTTYYDAQKNKYTVGFKVIDVLMDGEIEPYRVENILNGKRIRIGDANTYVAIGLHTYTIKYLTNRQIGYFKDHDELYWNVTGNGWIFPIDKVEVKVTLPSGISKQTVKLEGYTGYNGSTDKNYNSWIDENNSIYFTSSAQLGKRQGLTIVVGWPKGFVAQPTLLKKLQYFLMDNIQYLAVVLVIIFVLLYFLISWSWVGRDPAKGTIIPLYEPPNELTPAAVRYIYKMEFDQKTMIAAILNMAVKGYLKIERDRDTDYRLNKTGALVNLSSEEDAIARALFSSSGSIKLTNSIADDVQKALAEGKEKLSNNYQNSYFLANVGYIVAGFILSIISFVVVSIIATFTGTGEMPASITGIVLIIINVIFYYLIKAPTIQGRKIMDQIEGFKLFLGVAEKDRLNYMFPVNKTPELFEKFLPYALALDVEQEWAEQFADVFAGMADSQNNYHPSWYYADLGSFNNITHFTDSFSSSFSDAISSAATPPGSSSGFSGGGGGFGGGGFSGGGGGGGGGGGW